MFFLHTFRMRSVHLRVVFSSSNIILILQQFPVPHLHLHGIMIQFWKLQVFRPLWDAEKGKGWEKCLIIFWINIFNMFGSAVADFERFVFFAERHLINHSGLCRILVTPKMSVQSIQVEFITNLSAVCHKFINLNSTTMCLVKDNQEKHFCKLLDLICYGTTRLLRNKKDFTIFRFSIFRLLWC